jgi:toxin ParE1/3/4
VPATGLQGVTAKPVILRETAQLDVSDALDEYIGRGATRSAARFIDAVEVTCRGIARHPAAGSARYAPEVALPGLRYWELPGFRYLLFYKEFEDHVDVWRLLHRERDIADWLREER